MLHFIRQQVDPPFPPPDLVAGQLVAWDESFALGHPLIDAEHREILRLLNLLFRGWRDGDSRIDLSALHDELLANFDLHFANEEELLVRYHCPRQVAHFAQHRRLAAELRDIGQCLFSGESPEIEARLAGFIRDMLIEHVLGFDCDLKAVGVQ